MKIGVPVVEFLRVNYWSHLRQTAETDIALRASMPGMIVSPDKAVVYLGKTHLAIEYSGPTFVPAKLNEAMPVVFQDCREEENLIVGITGMKCAGTGGPLM